MRSPYGFEVFEDCLNCRWKSDRFFCNLPTEASAALNAMAFTTTFPAGSILFAEGQPPRGIYIMCHGRAKLTTASSEGKMLITRVAGEGEVLGISSAISGKPHKASAETVEPSQVNFVKREDFLRFLNDHGDACFRAAQQLADECQSAENHVRSLGLSHSAAEKMANLLLSWADEAGKDTEQGTRIKLTMTHQEIAQMIGTSRETVTRLLGDFKQKNLISVKGSTLIIQNRPALEALVLL